MQSQNNSNQTAMTSLSGGSVTSWAARAAAAQAIAERLPAAVEEAAGAAQAADDGACDEEGDDDHDEDEPPDEPALANRLKAWKKNRREHLNQTIPKISVHGEMTLIMIQNCFCWNPILSRESKSESHLSSDFESDGPIHYKSPNHPSLNSWNKM